MLTGHYVPSTQGNLFVVQFGKNEVETAVLCLPSIFEELNLSRAVVAKQAQYFANHGLPCFVMDYYGTGDSEGEIENATCDIWLDNILTIGHWLHQRGVKKIILWGIRFGALLILHHQSLLHQALSISQQLFWKPVTNGKKFAIQFIRIKQAHEIMNNGQNKVNWYQHIMIGNATEVGGYELTATFLSSMETLNISQSFQPLSTINWLDLSASKATLEYTNLSKQWQKNKVLWQAVDCPAFWQKPWTFTLPELYKKSFVAIKDTV